MKPVVVAALFLLCGCAAFSASAQKMYKWKDAKGVTHFSENPPPDGSNAEKIEVKPVGGERPALPPPPAPRAQKEPAAQAKQPGAEEIASRNDQQRAQKCETYKRELDTLSNSRPFTLNDKGERVFMEEKERVERMDEARKIVRENC